MDISASCPIYVAVKKAAYNERVSLPGVDLNRVDHKRVDIDAIRLDNGHVVPVNGEREVRVTRNADKPHTVPVRTSVSGFTEWHPALCSPLAVLDSNDRQRRGRAAGIAAETIDECGVGCTGSRKKNYVRRWVCRL